MELLIKNGECPENYIITEVIDGEDILGNVIKIAGEAGQHTIESITNNIVNCEAQILEFEVKKAKWNEYLLKINEFIGV